MSTECALIFLFALNFSFSVYLCFRLLRFERVVRQFAASLPHPLLVALLGAALAFVGIKIQNKLTK